MHNKKRRKLVDNPYNISFSEEKETYNIYFKNKVNSYELEVSRELYNIFDKFELEDISYMNKFDRHIEHLELDEIQLYNRTSFKRKSTEEEAIQNIENKNLHNAIKKLPKIQRNRIYLYYFRNMTQKEIAIHDNCSIRSVQYSLNIALKNLKKHLS